MAKNETANATNPTNQKTVTVQNGPGSKPIVVEWQRGDTRDKVLERAKVELTEDCTASVDGNVLRFGRSKVKPGDVIIVANRPRNGATC